MPSHLSTIGFDVATEEDFLAVAEQVSKDAQEIVIKGRGSYLRWTGSNGEELWLQLDAERQLIGLNPHFSGSSKMRVGVVACLQRQQDTPLDGALRAWASPANEASTDGEYPFVFDLPDAARYSDIILPAIAEAQIAAFAHEVNFFESEDAYYAWQSNDGPRFASQSFIPSGVFETDEEVLPSSEAVFTGNILESAARTNSLSGTAFYWALVDTFGGQYDVVIDRHLLPAPPAVGGILSGSFWLSGRLLTYPRKKPSWFDRLLGGGG